MDKDPIFVGESDIDAAREIVATAPDAELFLYPGDQHYFADSSLPSYDAKATVLLTRRVLYFLDRVYVSLTDTRGGCSADPTARVVSFSAGTFKADRLYDHLDGQERT